MLRIEEDFELELRSLPGVLNVGFDRGSNGGVDTVTLVTNGPSRDEIETVAQQITSLYYPEAAVVVEDVNRTSSPEALNAGRAALVRAEFDTSSGQCEVVLNYQGRLGTGRAGSGPLIGGVEATLGALRQLGIEIPYTLMSVSNMIAVRNWPVVVVLRSTTSGSDRFGIAQSESDVLAAAKATLSAVNRLPLRVETDI
jgi:hypothetical protein